MGKWVKRKLGEVAKTFTGLTYSPNQVSENGILVLRSSNIKDEQLCLEDNVFVSMDIPERAIVHENDILICVRNGSRNLIGKSTFIPKEAEGMAFGAFMTILRSDLIEPRLLLYIWQSNSIQRQVANNIGATINQITNTDFKNFDISYPSTLSEQRRIASILSSADKVIDSTQKLIAKYKSIKQGMMEDLLKPKEGWKKVKLGECCEKITDGSHESPVAVLEGYYMPSVKDMSYSSFNFSNCKQISESDYLKLKGLGCKPEIGDVLIAKDGSILKYCFVMEDDLPIVILSSIAILKPNKQIMDSNFLSFYFQKRDVVIDVVENYKSGTGVPRIVLKNFEQIEITYPISLIEQRRIASILSSIDAKIESEEKVLEKYKNIKKGLMEKLLKGEK